MALLKAAYVPVILRNVFAAFSNAPTLAASTMKIKILIVSILFSSCFDPKSRQAKLDKPELLTSSNVATLNIDCEMPKIENEILSSDTTIDYKKHKGHLIRYYDHKKRPRKILIANLYENNTANFFSSVKIYDTLGHVMYESQSQALTTWLCYNYKYDLSGHMIYKEGFGSGEIGAKVTYIYSGDKIIKTITERAGHKTELSY